MSFIGKSAGVGVLVALLGSAAMAQEPAPIVRTHDPVLATCAAMIDVVYLPLRIATTAVGGILGGFVGFITLGDKAAAESIWALSDGSQIVTPEMLEGVEPFHWTGYD
jgi:ABC-type transport system involved in cytochrome c biogenesis permease subunit